MPARTQNASQPALTKPNYASQNTTCIKTCVEQTPPMSARTQNASQHVLTKLIKSQQRLKMHFIMCWPNPSHASQDTKCISTSVEQTPPKAARTENATQPITTKLIQCQRGLKIHLNLCWPSSTMQARSQNVLRNPSHASQDTKCISTCFDQDACEDKTHRVLTELLPWKPGNKLHIYMCWPNLSNASEDTKCNWTCVEIKPIPWQWALKSYLNLCWRNPAMPERTENPSQHMLTKCHPC